MKISACVIAKNEAENLPRWLTSMRVFADEMIVVDTGSTDATVQIADAGGAKVFHFGWINDFAAAKNFALDKASGDWVVFTDADEYFTEESVSHSSARRRMCSASFAVRRTSALWAAFTSMWRTLAAMWDARWRWRRG